MKGKKPREISQKKRLLVLAISITALVGINVVITGTLLPAPGASSLWFYSAILLLLLGDLVVEPWYTSPADAVANSSVVLLTVIATSPAGLPISDSAFEWGRNLSLAVAGPILLVGSIAIASKRPKPQVQSRLHNGAYAFASTLGSARILFGAFFAVTAAAAFANEPQNLMVLYLFGIVVLIENPIELLIGRLGSSDDQRGEHEIVIEEIAQPRTAFASAGSAGMIEVGGTVRKGDAAIGVVVDVSESDADRRLEIVLRPGVTVKVDEMLAVGESSADGARLVGVVERGTTLDKLITRGSGARFDALGITEGSLLEADVRDAKTLYQVIDAEIKSSSPEGTALSKRVGVVARKLGEWKEAERSFEPVEWIPSPGSVAAIAEAKRTKDFDPTFVGRVPGTDYGTSYDPSTGATHNTAILGILGIGKTTLASELIWRTLEIGAKVVVIDITSEYATNFEGLFNSEAQEAVEQELNAKVRGRLNSRDFEDDEAGNKTLFRRTINEKIKEFLSGSDPLLILNPSRLTVTQDGGGYPDSQGRSKRVVSLNPAEVTAVIAEQILNHLSTAMSTELRVCLVLEEAHSLAPEWNSVANDGEKQAATATARYLMQGRKYGFGSIVVTQRTANVTKSILNQCNTVFALRVYDKTGTEFLGNFIGDDYAHLLANLKDRHAVVFGKASSCSSPLLIELNDSNKMDRWRDEILTALLPDTDDKLLPPAVVAPEPDGA